jgi:hypothetical protein
MKINTDEVLKMFDINENKKRDVVAIHHAIENDIRLLSAELLRVIRLPFMSEAKRLQILYLDDLISKYEADLRKYE